MNKQTILCVDDEIDNVDALERLFRQKYTVLKAGRRRLHWTFWQFKQIPFR